MSQTVAMKTLYGAVASLHNAAHLLAIQDNQAQALVRSYNLLDAETAKTKRKLAKAERELTKYRKKAARAAYKRRLPKFGKGWMETANVIVAYNRVMDRFGSHSKAIQYVKEHRFNL